MSTRCHCQPMQFWNFVWWINWWITASTAGRLDCSFDYYITNAIIVMKHAQVDIKSYILAIILNSSMINECVHMLTHRVDLFLHSNWHVLEGMLKKWWAAQATLHSVNSWFVYVLRVGVGGGNRLFPYTWGGCGQGVRRCVLELFDGGQTSTVKAFLTFCFSSQCQSIVQGWRHRNFGGQNLLILIDD